MRALSFLLLCKVRLVWVALSSLVCELSFYENSFLWVWGCPSCSLSMHLLWRAVQGHFPALELDARCCAPPASAARSCRGLAGCPAIVCPQLSCSLLEWIQGTGGFLGQDLMMYIGMYSFTTSSQWGGFYGKAAKCIWRNKHRSHSCSAEPVCFKPCFLSCSWSCQLAARHHQ